MERKEGEKLSRRERERERHRREMLDAAERVFVRDGFHQATVEHIAQEAEFAVGTIYNFFKSKEDLYARVIEKLAGDFLAMFEKEVLTKRDPEQAIGALIELRLKHFEEHRGFARVFLETSPASRLDLASGLPPSLDKLYDQYIETVTGIFERGIGNGSFEDLDPLYLTLCLEGIINAFVSYWSRREPSEPLATRVEKMRNAFLARVRAGPCTRHSPRRTTG